MVKFRHALAEFIRSFDGFNGETFEVNLLSFTSTDKLKKLMCKTTGHPNCVRLIVRVYSCSDVLCDLPKAVPWETGKCWNRLGAWNEFAKFIVERHHFLAVPTVQITSATAEKNDTFDVCLLLGARQADEVIRSRASIEEKAFNADRSAFE